MNLFSYYRLLFSAFFLTICLSTSLFAKDYYFHPRLGSDAQSGLSAEEAFQNLSKIQSLELNPGDRILLASGEEFSGSILIDKFKGTKENPLLIQSFGDSALPFALINAAGEEAGVLIQNSAYVQVKNLRIKANGKGRTEASFPMRVGVLVRSTKGNSTSNILLIDLQIEQIFYESAGFQRGAAEVKTANGTQKYGWGIRLMANGQDQEIEQVEIKNCDIRNLAHTGIKLTGNNQQSIRNITITGNQVEQVGGPGIQMSGVKFVYVADNLVSHSGSTDDSRKWGRGSGLWTWGSSMVLIEKNQFLYSNGPGDSAGAHIDFNCDNIILQYNLSAYNAGGFCEILGNNYNCAYRYNISVNDGHRVKGENGAFQEGKTLWLSGYQGEKKPRKGPVNSYIYNNTIFVSGDIVSKIAIDNRSKGVLIANNIFHIEGKSQLVAGDQYKPDDESSRELKDVFFKNNMFLHAENWPNQALIQPEDSHFGNVDFTNPGGMSVEDYIPQKSEMLKGIAIPFLPADQFGLMKGMELKQDILGNPIGKNPGIGAINFIEKP
ncbi:right-handed parallel beta-helix repeat-containing protein [Algoriphagus hitonicola]|uniref:Right handed beta helix region n=1 Tax=Algoriphagus hitonicola TaxID=435880 RepID=A0A1I2NH99_9BACT|nr:right-handed parallel beta-helix repeat-containing protein [Algoriphagus hitonicola]SFG02410.1 Right handed beta helix region [Algoriphagus hitonicola]